MYLNVNSVWRDIFTFRKKSLRYKISRRDFYEGRNFLNSQTRILNLIHQKSNNIFEIERPIRFYGLSFGVDQKKAIKHLGKPNYSTHVKLPLKNHKILFYRLTISNVKCVLQLHFLDNAFFLGVIEQKNAFSIDDQEIANLVRHKYGVEDIHWVGSIQDSNKNSIEISKGAVQRIVYSTGDSDMIQNIKYQLLQLEDKKEKYSQLRSELMLEMI
jgi:hypothetical protein